MPTMVNKSTLKKTSVALLIFNRPDTTRRVADAIARARPDKLLVVADGPRREHPDDAELCDKTRRVVEEIDWQCEVLTNYSEENLGCKKRVATGLDWVFSQVDEAIILEDDCLPEPSFFPYCEELLERYRNDKRVHMISGNNLLFGRKYCSSSYYFSRFYKIWGWASWARAWKHYDLEMSRWPEMRDTGWLEERLPTQKMVDMARYVFDETYAGNLTTWEYQWGFASWLQNAVSAVPAVNLVKNIGFGTQATHMFDRTSKLANLKTAPVQFPLRHPEDVKILERADIAEWDLLYGKSARRAEKVNQVRRRLRRIVSRGLGAFAK